MTVNEIEGSFETKNVSNLERCKRALYMLRLDTTCRYAVLILAVCIITFTSCWSAQSAANAQQLSQRPARRATAGVYPQFRSAAGVVRWIQEQMPLKVYVSPGLTLDSIIDEQLGAPVTNVDNLAAWPDLVASIIEKNEINSLSVAEGFVNDHLQAALAGINSWKQFEREGLFSFQLTDDPSDADIYVFWTNHFVNKLGLALFANDIRGYTAKRSFWFRQIQAGKHADFRPVVTLLRTTDGRGNPMPLLKMKASAAHEFGHALGIEGHSGNPVDLMSVYYGRGVISANDAATIRHLYRLTPDLIP